VPPSERPNQGNSPGWSLQSVPAPDRGVVVLASGEFDIAAVPDLRRAVSAAGKAQPKPARVVLDLSRVTFLDAAMLNTLVAERRKLQSAGGDLEVVGVTKWSMRVIEICGLRDTLGL
jgi:anti-anti-sigma factor